MKHNIKTRKRTSASFSFTSIVNRVEAFARQPLIITLMLFLFFCGKNVNAQCSMGCIGLVNAALDANGEFNVTPITLLNNPACDINNFSIEVVDANGNIVNNKLDCSQVGMSFTATLTEINSGNTCTGIITVADNLGPVVSCVDIFRNCYDDTTIQSVGEPTVNDNCTNSNNITLTHTDNLIDLPCSTIMNGVEVNSKIERTWTAVDASNNSKLCVQTIYFNKILSTNIVFPPSYDDQDLPSLDCQQDPLDLNITGQPSVNGIPITSGSQCEVAVSHSDQTVEICNTSSYKIVRTWSIVDLCDGSFTVGAQVIQVLDQTAPVINCPNDFTIGTNNNACAAQVVLPSATATDDCSNYNITVDSPFGIGLGPFTDVPVGVHTITYTATDECNNTSTCTIELTVEDDTAPVAICEQSVITNLDVDGVAKVGSESFNNASWDNCSIDYIEVSRDGVTYTDSVLFDCQDLGQTVSVQLRVFDTSGNSNECTSFIQVVDNINPTITCPADITIHCTDDLADWSVTGSPTTLDNCTISAVYYQEEIDLNACNTGIVTRTWITKDQNDNEITCTQIITIADNTPLEIVFPEDIDLYGCNAITAVGNTGEPVITSDDCENLGISFNDVEFDNVPGLCKKILRTWNVVDWCVYQPNLGDDGFHTHVQVIMVNEDASSTNFSVSGVITNFSGVLLDNVDVRMVGDNIDTMVQTVNGVYDFIAIPLQENVTIEPMRDGDDLVGVNTIDLINMRLHILGITPFNNPYQHIAADVNESGTVTTFDIVIMRQVILHLIPDFSNSSWIFVDNEYNFQDLVFPSSEDYNVSKTITPTPGATFNIDFTGVKKGDANGNASTN